MNPEIRTDELIVDYFAGGGGTSEGIKAATGREPDIAVNHDRFALAMHRINHPSTKHLAEDAWAVDPIGACAGRPVGLFWLSPDCKDFSKAKGGKPREKNIRGLAWVGFRWAKSLPKFQRPRVVILENVEEFQDWGPLLPDGRPCPASRGTTFKQYVAAWRALGYVVEWRELRAWRYGSPTIRKRLFLIARRDGQPIVWPDPTRGNPNDSGDAPRIAYGELLPWRTAAEIIDWSLPCPSIFETSAEIKARFGIRANRPLAPATMARIAKGTKRYVLDAVKPFIVPVKSWGGGGNTARSIDEPTRTVTASKRGEHAVVTPFVTKFHKTGVGQPVDQPLATVTAHSSETHPGGYGPLGVVAPMLVRTAHGDVDKNGKRRGRGEHSVEDPAPTVLASNDAALVSGFLVPRYGERPQIDGKAGQEPRTRSIEEPFPVVVPTGNEGSLAAVAIVKQNFGDKPCQGVDEPLHTVTTQHNKHEIVAAFLAQHNNHRGEVPSDGRDIEKPLSTIVDKGCTQGLVAAHMLNMKGSDQRGGPIDVPAPTFSAEGNHAAAVYAFLAKYYGEGLPSQTVEEPLHTVTAKPRHGVVTVAIAGEPYVIVDIGMRMLTPRERFSANGFPTTYVIDRGILEDGTEIRFTLEQQGRMCGNSVCPDVAEALVRANYVAPAVAKSAAA